jgi:hypothetical protein
MCSKLQSQSSSNKAVLSSGGKPGFPKSWRKHPARSGSKGLTEIHLQTVSHLQRGFLLPSLFIVTLKIVTSVSLSFLTSQHLSAAYIQLTRSDLDSNKTRAFMEHISNGNAAMMDASAHTPSTPILIVTSDCDESGSSSSFSSDNGYSTCAPATSPSSSVDPAVVARKSQQQQPSQQEEAKPMSSTLAYNSYFSVPRRPSSSPQSSNSSPEKAVPQTSPTSTNTSSLSKHISSIANNKRRQSSSQESAIPYRQSSIKWRQRNGSATFELKMSQQELMSRF